MAMNFDPMTGAPINNDAPKFDPMTGELINNDAPKFDPMTGQPVYDQMGKKKPKGKGVIIGAISAAAVVLVGGVVFFGVKSGMFLSAPYKVLLATYNTFTETSQFSKDMNAAAGLFEKEKLTTEVSLSIDDVDVEMAVINTKKEKQVNANIDISGYPEVEAVASIDHEYLKLKVPTLSDDVIGYNYVDNKTGYLVDYVDEEIFDTLDGALASIYEGYTPEVNEKFANDVAEVVKKECKKLEFEKADKEKFEINGKDVKCKGYTTTITEDFMIDLIEGVGDVVYEYYGEEIDSALSMEYVTWNEVMDEIEDEFSYMPEMEATFYIYKNKLACILLEVEDGGELEVLFLGGDRRAQNVEINIDGDTIMEIEGETDGSEETMAISADGEEVLEMSYDSKSGEYTIDAAGEFYMEGTIEASKKEFRMSIEELIVEGDYVGSADIAVSQGAELEKFDDDMFDIGNASESELIDFLTDNSKILEYLY